MVNMAALPDLITVAQFRQLPEGGELIYELHYGEVVSMTRPRPRHWKLQLRLSRLLTPKLKAFGEVITEVPYRPLAEFELRAADVAVISHERWDSIDPDDDLRGAPDLVIEVKSPSNTKRQLQELVALCLANGSIECWVVDMDRKSVSVVRREGAAIVYNPGDSIPLTAFGGGELAVGEIFG
jgi:Uma2 family endonuclease